MKPNTVPSSHSCSAGSGYYTAESHTNEVYVEEAPPEPALDYRRGNSIPSLSLRSLRKPRLGQAIHTPHLSSFCSAPVVCHAEHLPWRGNLLLAPGGQLPQQPGDTL